MFVLQKLSYRSNEKAFTMVIDIKPSRLTGTVFLFCAPVRLGNQYRTHRAACTGKEDAVWVEPEV